MTALTSELHGLDTARMLHTNLGRTKPLLILSRLLLVTVSISVPPFSLSSTSALAAQAETIQQLTAKAEEMMKQKKFGEAKKQLKKALKLDKNSFDANAFMAVIFREEKHRKEAIKYAYEAIRINPQRADLHYFLAVLLYETTESGQAKAELEKALSLGANFANAYSLKGDLEIEEDNFRAALEGYSKALTLLPETSADRQKIKRMVDMLTAYLTYAATKDRNGPAVTKPVALTLPRPNYTEDARSNHIQGVVRARVLIDETGLVKYFIPITRLGYGLDEEAQNAVFRMRFSPATVDHQPIPYWIVLEVTFNLR